MRLIERWAALAVAASLLCALGATRLKLSADYRIFFAEEDARLQALDELEGTFSKTDNVVFVVAPREGDVFTPRAVAAVADLTEAAGALPHVRRVDSLTNYTHARLDGEDLLIEPLFADPRRAGAEALAEAREIALAEPMLTGSLVATDGGAAGVNATLRLPDDGAAEVIEAADAARAIVEEVSARYPELEIRASGLAMLNDAFMQASVREIASTIPVMVVVMIAGMTWLLRSAVATAAVALVVALASGAALGVGGWLGYPLTPISASVPTILITLCVADGVHLVTGARQALAGGLGRVEAVQASLRANFKPVLLTSLSTAVGFLALNFADAPPFWHLANMTAAGVLLAFALSVTLLPALLARFPLSAEGRLSRNSGPRWTRFARWVHGGRWPLVGLGAALTVFAGGMSATLTTNDQFIEYFDASVPWRADTEFMLEHLSGLYAVDFHVPADGPGGVADPAHLEALDAFATRLRAEPPVTHVWAVSDLVKRLNHGFQGGAEGTWSVPGSRELAAQYLLAYEMSLPQGQTLAERVDVEKASSRVTVLVSDISSQEMRALTERAEGWLAALDPSMAAPAVSPVVLFSHLSDTNSEAMTRGNLASLALISLGLAVALGSARLGLLSMVPNLLPIALAYGVWAVVFKEMNIVSSIAAAVCLGIVVDDTIHFLAKYQRARDEKGLPCRQALEETMRTVGGALVLTSVILIAGFAVLSQSTFAVNSTFGRLVILVVGLALMADLFILPACLAALDTEPELAPDPAADPETGITGAL